MNDDDQHTHSLAMLESVGTMETLYNMNDDDDKLSGWHYHYGNLALIEIKYPSK